MCSGDLRGCPGSAIALQDFILEWKNMAQDQTIERPGVWPQQVRRAALYVLFALVLLIPKTLSLRHQPRAWNALRAVVAILGAALIVVPVGISANWFAAVIGLFLFVAALLAPPTRPEPLVDDHARELGALVVVNGGQFSAGKGEPVAAQLYVAPDRVIALGPEHDSLVEIPTQAVSSLRAEPSGDAWKLRVAWDGSAAEFFYHGIFAEHLARVAENALRSQLQRELRVLKKAAG